jgi:hypothetical protein
MIFGYSANSLPSLAWFEFHSKIKALSISKRPAKPKSSCAVLDSVYRIAQ